MLSERTLRDMEEMAREQFDDYQTALADLEAIVGTDPSNPIPAPETTQPKVK